MSRQRSITFDKRRTICDRAAALSIAELEDGLKLLQQAGTNREDFWAANDPAFRETLRIAIHETSEALRSEPLSSGLRAELEGQLVWLTNYLSPRPQTLN
jgi:hypothetical protein